MEGDITGARLVGLGANMDPSHRDIALNEEEFRVGRSATAHLLIKDINISREQAVFHFKQFWTITDHSSNGVRVNGKKIPKGIPERLSFKDEIILSDQDQKYHWRFLSQGDKENTNSTLEDTKAPVSSNDVTSRKRAGEMLPPAKRVKFSETQSSAETVRLERVEGQRRTLLQERERVEREMVQLKQEKERVEEEQRRGLEAMMRREEENKEELKRREEENQVKQQQILQMIENEKARASSSEEENEKKEQRISALEKQMSDARFEADAIIQQEKDEKERICREMEEQREKLIKLSEEKERAEAELRQRLAEMERQKEETERERRRREEENQAKQQEIIAEIEMEKARTATSEEENRRKEEWIQELEQEMQRTVLENQATREQGAKEVLERVENTLEQQMVCSTCLELLIHSVFLNCGHSYCWLCLQQWKHARKSTTCPQCRVEISTETKGISMDNMIDAIIQQLGSNKVEERRLKVNERIEHEEQFRRDRAAEEQELELQQSRRGSRNSRGGRGRGRGRGGGIQEMLRLQVPLVRQHLRPQAPAPSPRVQEPGRGGARFITVIQSNTAARPPVPAAVFTAMPRAGGQTVIIPAVQAVVTPAVQAVVTPAVQAAGAAAVRRLQEIGQAAQRAAQRAASSSTAGPAAGTSAAAAAGPSAAAAAAVPTSSAGARSSVWSTVVVVSSDDEEEEEAASSQRRQEELERKAAELARREEELKSSPYNARGNNWPPLPSFLPFQPCFYQDINVDIPVEFQEMVKRLYYLWLFHALLMLANMVAGCALLISGNDEHGQTFGLALVYSIIFIPLSYVCWFRPAYKAFRSDSSFNFMVFFFIFFTQFLFSCLMALGIYGTGGCGIILAIATFKTGTGGGYFVGVLLLISAIGFICAALADFFMLTKIHGLYRATGASLAKAQQEFTSNVLSNEGVRNAAAQAAAAGVRNTFSGGQNQQNPGPRY